MSDPGPQSSLEAIAAANRDDSTAVDWTTYAKCLGCGYSLKMLAADRCPECGRGFDRSDRSTMSLPASLMPQKKMRGKPVTLTELTAVAGALLCLSRIEEPLIDVLCWLFWFFAVGQLVIACLTPARSKSRPSARTRWTAAGLLLAGMLSTAGWGSCPHSSWYYLGPFGLSYSTTGGPCRNHNPDHSAAHLAGNWWVF